MSQWNADAYHRVSDPMVDLGLPVLERLPLQGHETVVDLGCGTGRVTKALAARLRDGTIIAVDDAAGMLDVAGPYLADAGAARVLLVRADAAALPFHASVDAVFSTATLHWVPDHPGLFRGIFLALKPGGRLVAQCGGGPNIERLRTRMTGLMGEHPFAPFFESWRETWTFADATTTAERLRAAGFVEITTGVEPTPIVHPDAASFSDFVAHIICGRQLACLPDPALRTAFVERLASMAAADDPPFELDYWRLNISARRPPR